MKGSAELEAGGRELLKQVAMAARGGACGRDYLAQAVERIDKEFGDGYAREHPELVGDYMQTAASDFETSMWLAVEVIVQAIERLCGRFDAKEVKA